MELILQYDDFEIWEYKDTYIALVINRIHELEEKEPKSKKNNITSIRKIPNNC